MSTKIIARALACAALAFAAAAHAGDAAEQKFLARLTPAQRVEAQRALAQLDARRLASPAGGKIDQAPPVLTGLKVKGPSDVSAPLAQVEFDVTATDDLSGVAIVFVSVGSPDGQQSILAQPSWVVYPERKFQIHMGADASAYLQGGTWLVLDVFLRDAEGNSAYFSTDQIAALGGDTTVTLANSHAKLVDTQAPALVSGKIRTPSMSISAILKGTESVPQSVLVDVDATDSGSGLANVSGTWYLADMSTGFTIDDQTALRGVRKGTMHLNGQVNYILPGVYSLYSLWTFDQAGNAQYLVSTQFGGDTDFSTYFPDGTTITLTP